MTNTHDFIPHQGDRHPNSCVRCGRSRDDRVHQPEFTDPRELGGDMTKPSDSGEVEVDLTRGLLVDRLTICKVVNPEVAPQRDTFALLLEGQVNATEERAKVVLLGTIDLMAALVTQVRGIAEASGMEAELNALCDERWPHPS